MRLPEEGPAHREWLATLAELLIWRLEGRARVDGREPIGAHQLYGERVEARGERRREQRLLQLQSDLSSHKYLSRWSGQRLSPNAVEFWLVGVSAALFAAPDPAAQKACGHLKPPEEQRPRIDCQSAEFVAVWLALPFQGEIELALAFDEPSHQLRRNSEADMCAIGRLTLAAT